MKGNRPSRRYMRRITSWRTTMTATAERVWSTHALAIASRLTSKALASRPIPARSRARLGNSSGRTRRCQQQSRKLACLGFNTGMPVLLAWREPAGLTSNTGTGHQAAAYASESANARAQGQSKTASAAGIFQYLPLNAETAHPLVAAPARQSLETAPRKGYKLPYRIG